MKAIVTVSDVAVRLRVSKTTVFQLVDQGDLPPGMLFPQGVCGWSREVIDPYVSRLAAHYQDSSSSGGSCD